MISSSQDASRGFFSSLYDLSFQKFVTPTIIQIIYILALIIIAIWSLVFLVAGFAPHFGYGYGGASAFSIVFHIVGAAVIFVVGSIVARINLEFLIAVFRIAENTESLRTRD